MTISLTHATVAVGTEAGNGEVGKDEWNADHTLTMAANFILGRTTAGTGAVEELSAADVRTFLNVEDGADVTDTTNVTAAGALMDSELSSEASVKAINQGLATTDSPTFAGLTTTGAVTLGGNTEIDGALTIDGDTDAYLNLDVSASGEEAAILMRNNDSARWAFKKNAEAESGSNVGSNFQFVAYNDAGSAIGSALQFRRYDLKATLGGNTEIDGTLTIDGPSDAELYVQKNASGNAARMRLQTGSSNRWVIEANSSSESGSDAGSDFSVARYSDASALLGTAMVITRSNGYINIQGVYDETTASAANVFVDTDGSLRRSTSSLRYKINVEDMTYGLKDVLNLRPVTYTPKPNGENEGELANRYGGLIAEEVDAAGLKEFVNYNDEGQPDSLHYGHMVALLVKAIQDLKAEVDELRSKLNG